MKSCKGCYLYFAANNELKRNNDQCEIIKTLK
jgi:hypothetical protein